MVGKTISHYKILEKLGEGGMGVVYKAEDTRLDRTVALKFLSSYLLESDEARRRFVHEAKAAATLDHPSICTVYEIDERDEGIFLAMAYIDGPTLQKKIEQRPLKLEEAVYLAVQIGEGLEAAHERGVVHRDIKSANILLTSRGQAKITDFGLAILSDRTRLTQAGAIIGTPAYMSPEQARSEAADPRSDIWSLGVVLYEMVSGRLPFGGDAPPAVIFAILHQEPEPLTALRSGVPLELDRIVVKALAKNPEERYQHIADLLVDLRSVQRLLEARPQAPPAQAAAAERGAVSIGQTLGHYRLEEKLGEGGMGIVFRALDTHLGRPAAIKVLKTGRAGSEQKKRFVQEAKAASALNHPNIVHIYDIAESEGVDYIAMEFVDGSTLDRLIPPKGMKRNEALRYAIAIADALAKAHAAGIVHRDLKPFNIMARPDGVVKILDFGLAKLLETSAAASFRPEERPQSEEGSVAGTLAYMSPEQAQGATVDSRSDIFSFGAVLYEMVTGKRAFQGSSRAATMAALLAQEPTPPAELVSDLPIELDKAILRCLRKDPRRRWQSFTDLKVVLEDLLEESESGKGAPAAGRRVAHVPLWAALLAFALLLSVAAVVWWLRGGEAAPREQKMARLTADAGLTVSPTTPRDGRLMAYTSDRSGDGNLDIWLQWIEAAAGRQPIRLTNHPANDYAPSFSSDGSRIVFRSSRDGGGLYLLDPLAGEASGGSARRLVDGGWHPRFSPDGKRIVYVQYAPSGLTSANKIYLVPADGGAPQVFQPDFGVYGPPASFGAIWSPDGKYLLFNGVGGSPPVGDWWVAPADGGPAVRAQFSTAIPRTGAAQPPLKWTGGDIVFIRGSTVEGYNLFSVPIEDKTWRLREPLRQLTTGPGIKSPGALLPDGRLLFDNFTLLGQVSAVAFDSGLATTSGQVRLLTHDAWNKMRASVSADGSKVAYGAYGGLETPIRQIRIHNLNTGRESQLAIRALGPFPTPALSPDGSFVAYTEDVDGRQVSFLAPAEGGPSRQICEGCSVAAVFPGAKSLLVGEKGSWLKLDLDPVQRTPVFSPPPGTRVREVHLSADGLWLVVLLDKGAENTVYVLPMGSLPITRESWTPALAEPHWVSCPRLTPNGKWLVYYSDKSGDLSVYAREFDPTTHATTGEPHVVLEGRIQYLTAIQARMTAYLEVARDRLFVPYPEFSGNIWMTQTDLRW